MPQPFEVDIEEVEYLRHGEKPLLARIYRPRGKGPFPAVVEAHGGAWVSGNRANNEAINLAVARGGVVVAAIDFRCPPEATYPASVADMNYAVRWLKANAARFNTRPDLIGTMGTSSGGHLAVLVAMKPHDPRYSAIPFAGAALDARVGYVVTLWPVICPIGRWHDTIARESRAEPNYRSRNGHIQQQYWLTEEAMAEGSPNLALQRGDKVELPDMLYLQNPIDTLHPRANLDSFVAGYRKAGGNLQLEFFEGPAYDLVRTDPTSESARGAIAKIVAFIQARAAAAGVPQAA
jgi:acetyl esterase/lipase